MLKIDYVPLYVIETRKSRHEPARPLTVTERLSGWRPATHDGEPIIYSEGHERGRLHSLSGQHLITWCPESGDRIVATLRAKITTELYPDADAAGGVTSREISARVEPWEYVGNDLVGIQLTTAPGRPVALGEDGVEDAFGHDALEECLRARIQEEDLRPAVCAVELVEFDEPASGSEWDAAYDALKAQLDALIVSVSRED